MLHTFALAEIKAQVISLEKVTQHEEPYEINNNLNGRSKYINAVMQIVILLELS